jgi:hypothetical protein
MKKTRMVVAAVLCFVVTFYVFARDFDARTGRYIEVDPVGLQGGINPYVYVEGNPLSRVDPLGLSSLIFNPSTGTLTVVNGAGQALGDFPAANNAQRSSRGPWPPGNYNYAYHMTHPNDAPDSPYGSYGNFVFNVPGCIVFTQAGPTPPTSPGDPA